MTTLASPPLRTTSLLARYCAELATQRSPRTVETYQRRLLAAQPWLTTDPAVPPTPERLLAYAEEVAAQRGSTSTVTLYALTSYTDYLVANALVPAETGEAVRALARRAAVQLPPPEPLTPEEVVRLLTSSWDDARACALIALILATGARCELVVTRRLRHVRVEDGAIVLSFGGGRDVPLAPFTRAPLRRLLAWRKQRPFTRTSPYLFPALSGRHLPLARATTAPLLRAAAERAGIALPRMTSLTARLRATTPLMLLTNGWLWEDVCLVLSGTIRVACKRPSLIRAQLVDYGWVETQDDAEALVPRQTVVLR